MIAEPTIRRTNSNVNLRLYAHARGKDFAYDQRGKKSFHQLSRKLLAEIAAELGSSVMELRTNLGGAAVSGETTLHTDRVYIQISKGGMGEGREVLYRSVTGTSDYSGGSNNFLSLQLLAERREIALDRFRAVSRKG
jgi:hypothetical protein